MSPRKERSATAAPAFLPLKAAETWNALLDEVRLCLRDDNRSRGRFNDIVGAVNVREFPWPTRGMADEYLVSGFLADVLAFSMAGPSRRPWLAKWLADKVEMIEGLVDSATLDADAPYVLNEQLPPPPGPVLDWSAPKTPEPGDPDYRADLHG